MQGKENAKGEELEKQQNGRVEEKGGWKVSTKQKRGLVGFADKSIERRILQDLVEIYIFVKTSQIDFKGGGGII